MHNFAARNVPVMMDIQSVGPDELDQDPFARITLRLPGGQEIRLTAALGGEDYNIATENADQVSRYEFNQNDGERGVIVAAAKQIREALAVSGTGMVEELGVDTVDADAIKFCAKCPTLIPVPHLAAAESELCVLCADVG